MTEPLASIIVPTKNSAQYLKQCLISIRNQDYKRIELIVVDNFSTDETPSIAKDYSDKFYQIGPERSTQRNFGVMHSEGTYVFIIDSDMELGTMVVKQCIRQLNRKNIAGVVIPEQSIGTTFWAHCKALERSFYQGVSWMEAARSFRKSDYIQVGGYDEAMISGEDWDLSQRIAKLGKIGRIDAYIKHNEGDLRIIQTLKKKYYYSKSFGKYQSKQTTSKNVSKQTSLFYRYLLFLSHPYKLFKNPILGFGMLTMKTSEFAVGALGMIITSFETIFVDNDSKDNSVAYVRKNYPFVKIIRNKTNLGFASGCNVGIQKAKGKTVMLMNNDVWVDENFISEALKMFDESNLDLAGVREADYVTKKSRQKYISTIDPLGFFVYDTSAKQAKNFYLTGACILFRRSYYNAIGGLDNDFFMYCEDIDLCWRIHLLGGRIGYLERLQIYHASGGSTQKGLNINRFRWRNENTLQMLIKNYSFFSLVLVIPVYIAMSLFEGGMFLLLGKPKIALTYYRALIFNISILKKTLAKRSQIQRDRKINDRELFRYMYHGYGKYFYFKSRWGKL